MLQLVQAARPSPEPLELPPLLFCGCVLICGVLGAVGATATGDRCTLVLLLILLLILLFVPVPEATVLLL